jgi:N-acetylmuramoyl-L-alanine amidase
LENKSQKQGELNMNDHLLSNCYNRICSDPNCKEIVKQNEFTGRWFITMGHAGFNTGANNSDGYSEKSHALKINQKYSK